jgi:O-antigen/teichoic acid export membrane protein
MNSRAIVTRNAFSLLLSQIVTNGLSFLTVPLVARSLGTVDYGHFYLASVIAAFAGMLAECGQEGYVILAVARSNSRANELLTTSALLRVGLGIAIMLPLNLVLHLLGYEPRIRSLAMLIYCAVLISMVTNATLQSVKGLEKLGPSAWTRALTEFAHTAFLFGAIWLGWGLRGVAGAEIATALVGALISVRILYRMRLRPAAPTLSSALELLRGGLPFFLWATVLTLQPSIEGVLLSKFASDDAVGWFGAANKLVNILIFPAVILASALGPTTARLYGTDPNAYSRAVRESFRAGLLLGVPVAVGSFVFADQGVALVFGGKEFGPAADNMRVFSAWLLPVFLNIVLGTALFASGRQLAWTFCKGAAVLLGAGASVLLIPWFQARTGNGGLGAVGVTAFAEICMLGAAFMLLPKGVLGWSALSDILRALGGAAAMVGTAQLLRGVPLLVSAPCALAAYALMLLALGGVRLSDLSMFRSTFRGAVGGS